MVLTPLRQSCTWRSRTGSDGYGPTYTNYTIACRFQRIQKSYQKPDGTIGIYKATIRCAEAVKANDKIIYGGIESIVLDVVDIPGPAGGIIEREVRL